MQTVDTLYLPWLFPWLFFPIFTYCIKHYYLI